MTSRHLSPEERRKRAAYAEISAEYDAVVKALGRQGWLDLLTRRRAARLARARARRQHEHHDA